MKIPLLKNLAAALLALSVSVIGALGLSGCGGGGGGSDEVRVIAPESMDQVKIDFFKAFDLELYRLSGTAGNERGAVKYTMLKNNFRYAIPADSGGNLGITIGLPLILTQMSYEYVRTGPETGRLTFSFQNNQVYPWPKANKDNPNGPVAVGDMFWGGSGFSATQLIVDILFTDQGGFIGSTTTRLRSGYRYFSSFTDPGPAVDGFSTFDFDSTDSTFRLLTGGGVPTAYNPYTTITDKTPASAVWTTFQGKKIVFSGSDGTVRIIGHQSTGGPGPEIPGEKTIEESGSILVDVVNNGIDGVKGVGGTYSYTRTGGERAKFAIKYQDVIGGVPQTVTLIYDMDFDGLDLGTYVDSAGISGTFTENLVKPLP
jgi:hypothetical protein